MRSMTLADLERLRAQAEEADVAFQMDEEAFQAFYDRTARALWAYLSRITGDRQLADDLLQEAYFRFLRAGARLDSEAHRRNYLYRVATNLARDGARRRRSRPEDQAAPEHTEALAAERELLWLAHAEGWSHREIGASLGLKPASVKLLVFRARRRLAGLLRGEPATGDGGSRP
jgi:RNA polymerase sigma-70 factor (ECF subfamily)